MAVNSNTSKIGTQRIEAGCRPHVGEGTHVDYVNVEAGLGLGPRVVGQVWVDVYFHLEAPQKESDLEEFLAPFQTDFRASVRNLVGTMFRPGSDPELAGWIVDDMSSAPPKVALSEAAHSLSNMAPLLEHMPQLTAPIAAINFEWRPTDVESLARRGIRTTLMPGLGHFGMMEDPDRFNQQLEETVESFAVRA